MPPSANAASRARANKTWPAVIPVSLGLATVALFSFAWLSEEVLDRGSARFDSAVRGVVHEYASPPVTAIFRFVTNLGDWPVVLACTLALIFFFLYRRDRDHLGVLLVTMMGAGVLDGVLKLAFHRLRPDPFFGAKPTTYSFPSGHSLISFCFYGLIAGMINFQLEERWQRVLVWCVAGLLIGLIGLSRIYLGVHWPTDVAAGYAAAIIWMGAVRVMARRVEARRARRLAQTT
jgi:undecaprenyl-diphosphatase